MAVIRVQGQACMRQGQQGPGPAKRVELASMLAGRAPHNERPRLQVLLLSPPPPRLLAQATAS